MAFAHQRPSYHAIPQTTLALQVSAADSHMNPNVYFRVKFYMAGERLVAVAALLQTQTSAIVTLKSSDIDSPKKLDGKRYASYEGRFEMPIVQQLIRDDGGEGLAIEVKPGEHGLG